MPGWKRADLIAAIEEGGSVLLPDGTVTRSKDDLPSESELKKLHESSPPARKSRHENEPAVAAGDPIGNPDPKSHGEDLDSDNPNPVRDQTPARGAVTSGSKDAGGSAATGEATSP